MISTWFPEAVASAWVLANQSYQALDIVEDGASYCEQYQCDGTVGWGGSPDTNGETTLDALIMDGATHDVGAVGYLRNIRNAITMARKVMHYTTHTILAGDGATNFSVMMGQNKSSLYSKNSTDSYNDWIAADCQHNYYLNVVGQNTSCGPYVPIPTPAPTPLVAPAAPVAASRRRLSGTAGEKDDELVGPQWVSGEGTLHKPYLAESVRHRAMKASSSDHDTIGMCALDVNGGIAVGMSSNGANHKIAGRIGDAPIVGAGGYASNDAGCAAATGDGDITMRFLPAYQAVENMRRGMTAKAACEDAVRRIMQYYTTFELGLICMAADGSYGAAGHGWTFSYAVAAPSTQGSSETVYVTPLA